MRALILVLSAVVLALAVSILMEDRSADAGGPKFTVARLISDAREGEVARYGDDRGWTLTWRVLKAVPAGTEPPYLEIRTVLEDRAGTVLSNEVYQHMVTVHGLFPLMAPKDPQGYDRLWVWTRLRPEAIDLHGRRGTAWRFDLIDPALPPNADNVVVWMDEHAPVFGIVRWQRDGRTWTIKPPE